MIPGLALITLEQHTDSRGSTVEVSTPELCARYGWPGFLQWNQVTSHAGALRGLHSQPNMGKLVIVLSGAIFDAGVDQREGSISYRQTWGMTLRPGQALYVPPGCAHGYLATVSPTVVLYGFTERWNPLTERVYRWDAYGIRWPTEWTPVLSPRDEAAA